MVQRILLRLLLNPSLLLALGLFAQSSIRVLVRDPTGTLISTGQIELRCSNGTQTKPFLEGRITLTATQDCLARISSNGFASRTFSVQQLEQQSEIVLAPAPKSEMITVSASRSPLAPAGLPVNVSIFKSHELTSAAATTIDDKLRQFPGFSLFRRSGSSTANPTTQGVSLRGLGASGTSRTLILQDGIPLNDPFGGWVYWGRVPLESIDQVEIMEGGASDLYGSNALGGVVYVKSHSADQKAFYGESAYGSSGLGLGSGTLMTCVRGWGLVASGEDFRTGGYIPVASKDRGEVDRAANSKHQTADVLIERSFRQNASFSLRGSLFGESRQNGTVLQINSSTIRQLAANIDLDTADGKVMVRLFGGTQSLHQTFSAISVDRNVETLTTDQRVPVQQYGFSAQWSSKARGRQIVSAGVDGRDITGDTNEMQVAGPVPIAYTAGGRQQLYGFFVEDLIQLKPKWLLTVSGRGDIIRYLDARSRRFQAGGALATTDFHDRSRFEVSPRVGIARVVTGSLSLHASAYRAFRAATLNELYRPFRVGNISTLSNAGLKPEHFTGGEIGAAVHIGERVFLRGTGYFGWLEDSIGNITINVMPQLITRQRQNIATVRLRGFGISAESWVTDRLLFVSGYQFAESTIISYRGAPTLAGLMVPQVPRHSVTFGLTYTHPKIATFVFQGRAESTAYDDDQNKLPLDPYLTLGMFVSRRIHSGVDLFLATENLLNSRYAIGRTPTPTVAIPIQGRVGLRLYLSRAPH